MTKNIFIVGMDEFNLEKIKNVPAAKDCKFHAAIDINEIRNVNDFDIEKLISIAEERINAVDGRPSGIITYFDFPAQDIVPILISKFGLKGPDFESVLKCEHKFWSRLAQQECIPKHIPTFMTVDPFDENVFNNIEIPFPFWIKPFRSFRSYLAFEITNRQQFKVSIEEIRNNIQFIHRPFMKLLEMHELPDSISKIKESCIIESSLYGRQCTVEGYVFNGEINFYGVVDSLKENHFSSFSSYEYPSSLEQWIQDKIRDVATTFIKHIKFDNSAFNMEFFYNTFTEEVYLLEVNTRISQSHADLFEKVHGISNHQVMLQIALGEHPTPLGNNGKFKYASKFMLRTFEVGTVVSVPSKDSIEKVIKEMPDTIISVLVEEGQELEQLELQDSYSYELAEIYIGGNSRSELKEKYDRALDMLNFKIQNTL